MKNQYLFSSKPYKHLENGGWVFATIPNNISVEIRTAFKKYEEGWGRLKIQAQIGTTIWKTSIWFDTKQNNYLLPIKKEIITKEKIILDRLLEIKISI